MESIRNIVKEIIDSLNPTSVDWQNAGNIAIYLLSLGIFLTILVAIFFGIKNIDKAYVFIKATFAELKKVSWLSREDTYKFTIITLAMIVVSTIFIVLADQAFLLLRGVLISTGA